VFVLAAAPERDRLICRSWNSLIYLTKLDGSRKWFDEINIAGMITREWWRRSDLSSVCNKASWSTSRKTGGFGLSWQETKAGTVKWVRIAKSVDWREEKKCGGCKAYQLIGRIYKRRLTFVIYVQVVKSGKYWRQIAVHNCWMCNGNLLGKIGRKFICKL
jgi:hypothetical protein